MAPWSTSRPAPTRPPSASSRSRRDPWSWEAGEDPAQPRRGRGRAHPPLCGQLRRVSTRLRLTPCARGRTDVRQVVGDFGESPGVAPSGFSLQQAGHAVDRLASLIPAKPQIAPAAKEVLEPAAPLAVDRDAHSRLKIRIVDGRILTSG